MWVVRVDLCKGSAAPIKRRFSQFKLFLYMVSLRCRHIGGKSFNRTRLRTQQQIECCDVRDHQQGYIDDRDEVGGAQLSRHGRSEEHTSELQSRLHLVCRL